MFKAHFSPRYYSFFLRCRVSFNWAGILEVRKEKKFQKKLEVFTYCMSTLWHSQVIDSGCKFQNLIPQVLIEVHLNMQVTNDAIHIVHSIINPYIQSTVRNTHIAMTKFLHPHINPRSLHAFHKNLHKIEDLCYNPLVNFFQ